MICHLGCGNKSLAPVYLTTKGDKNNVEFYLQFKQANNFKLNQLTAMTTTFAASPVSIRSFGAITNWLLLLMVLIWAECMMVCHCSVIKRSDVNDIMAQNSEKADTDENDAPAEKMQSQLMNCYPVSSCYDDCTERLKGKLHTDHDCTALGAEYGFRATFVCQCHFEDIVHEDEYEGSNELPIFSPHFYKSNSPKSKRNMKSDSLFLVSNNN